MKISKELFQGAVSSVSSDIFDRVNADIMKTAEKKCTKELVKTMVTNFVLGGHNVGGYKVGKHENNMMPLLISVSKWSDSHLKKESALLLSFYEKNWNSTSINSSLIAITLAVLLSSYTKIAYRVDNDKAILIKGLSKTTLDGFVKKLNELAGNPNYNYFDFIVNKIYTTISNNIKELKKPYIVEGDSPDGVKVKKGYNTIEEAVKSYVSNYKKSKNIHLYYYIPNSKHKHIENSLDRISLLKYYGRKVELGFDFSDKLYNKYKNDITCILKALPNILEGEYLIGSFYTQIYDEFNKLDNDSNNELSKSGFVTAIRKYAAAKYGKFGEFILKFGNLNYQVGNGGFRQYIDNGYASGNKTLVTVGRLLEKHIVGDALKQALDVVESFMTDGRSQYVLDRLDTQYYAISDNCGMDPIDSLGNMFYKIFKTKGNVNDTVKYINDTYLK